MFEGPQRKAILCGVLVASVLITQVAIGAGSPEATCQKLWEAFDNGSEVIPGCDRPTPTPKREAHAIFTPAEVAETEPSVEASLPTTGATGGTSAVIPRCGKGAADLEIVSVIERRSPRRLIIRLRNNEHRFVGLSCWRLRIDHQNGMVSEASFGKRMSITYQKSRLEVHADTDFVFTPKRLFEKVPERGLKRVNLQYFYGKQPGYSLGDTVRLLSEDNIVDEWVAVGTPMAPVLIRNAARSWAAVKENRY